MTSSVTNQIVDLRNELHRNVSQVHANQMQCERLCQRIDRLVEPLERLEHATKSVVREETRPILENLLQCIDDCNNYVERLQSPEQWQEEVYEYKKSEEKFREFNQRLSQIGHDLSLGLNIQQLFDRKQDQEDQKADLQDLTEKVDEISQKMLDKQCEQYHLIDKMMDKRFQSFRLYFARNLLLQQNNLHSQALQQEQQHFLSIPYKDLYIEDKPLGRGGFADVYRATWLTHHDQVAIKIIRISHLSENREDFQREISMMYRIRYENVLSVLGACVEPNFYAIIVEYMPLGSLYDILHKQAMRISFDWSDRYSLSWQMAKSINYLHTLNPSILHRDIKSMNFLLRYNGSANQKYLLKVCDFGLAEIRRETLLQSASYPTVQLIGSFYWKAPELLIPFSRHTKQSDIFSLGMVFWELATERKPWDEYEDEAIILIQLKTGGRPSIPSNVPEKYQEIIEEAWNHKSQKRPTCFQLMERIQTLINQPPPPKHQISVIDLHPTEQTATEQYYSLASTTKTSSTITAIQVTDEEQNLLSNVPQIIISESSQVQTVTEDQTDVPRSKILENEPSSLIKKSPSSSSLAPIEDQKSKCFLLPSPLQRTFSKSVEDLSSNSKADGDRFNPLLLPIYRVEKRRPLHRKS